MVTKTKNLLSKYHKKLQKKLGGVRGEFLYRGQEDSDWKLQSGVVRRMLLEGDTDELRKLIEKHKKGFDFGDENLRYHEELLEQAKLRGWHRETGGRELKDLEMLAKLQHHGAATCLLDFTTRFDIALWFACRNVRDENKDKDGKIFIVDINSFDVWDLWQIGSDDLGCSIGEILRFETREAEQAKQASQHIRRPRFWYWYPETLMGRMLSQGSRFLFGLENALDDGKDFVVGKNIFDIEVKQAHKKQLLDELIQRHGLSQENIFFDIHGFATINNHRTFFRWRDTGDYFKEGRRKIQIGNFSGAIEDFSGVINLNSGHINARRNRALLYRILEKYDKSREDFQYLQTLYERQGDQEGLRFAKKCLQELDEI